MVETDDYLALEEEQIEFLSGLCHSCPICFSQLSLRSMPGEKESHWFCPDCKTEWPVGDLIDALNYNELGKED